MQLLSIAQCLLMFSQHCSQACAGTVQNAKHSAPAAYHLIMHTLPGRTPMRLLTTFPAPVFAAHLSGVVTSVFPFARCCL